MTFFFLGAAFLIMNAGAAWIQNKLSERVVSYIREEAADHGIELKRLKYRCSGFSSLNALRWKTISGQVEVIPSGAFSEPRVFDLTVQNLEAAWIGGLFSPLFEIRMGGLKTLSGVLADTLDETKTSTEKTDHGELRLRMNYTFWNPRKARREVGAIFNQLDGLVRKGKTTLGLDFKTAVLFEVHGVPIKASIESERHGGVTFLRMPVQDLITISAVLDEGLTSHEIRILSENPLLAPRLLKIRNAARRTAYRAGKEDASVPKDAYRHVLWSYLLTREFGEAFSERVTRAHEINAVLENTAAQNQMDFTNNAIGRQYARLGYEESSLLKRLMKDPSVIRYSSSQKGR